MMDSFPSGTIILKKNLFYKVTFILAFYLSNRKAIKTKEKKAGRLCSPGKEWDGKTPTLQGPVLLERRRRPEGGLEANGTSVVYRIVYQTVEILPQTSVPNEICLAGSQTCWR